MGPDEPTEGAENALDKHGERITEHDGDDKDAVLDKPGDELDTEDDMAEVQPIDPRLHALPVGGM